MRLKSDHFGIEMRILRFPGLLLEKLKSDHFGIEIILELNQELGTEGTKIRPFWD